MTFHRTDRRKPRGVATGVLAVVIVTFLATISLQGTPAAAQGAEATPDSSSPRSITMSGEGRVTVTPDIATVTVGVETMQPSLSEAQAEATSKMEAIIQAAKDAGVAEDDIVTTNYSVNVIQEYDRNGNPTEISGYRVGNQVELTVRNIDDLGALLEAVVAQGANTIYGISFSVDDPTTAASQARRQAVENARQKADELADAVGAEITGVLSIKESAAPSSPPEVYEQEMAGADMAQGAAAPVPIQPGTGEIVVIVQVVYEING